MAFDTEALAIAGGVVAAVFLLFFIVNRLSSPARFPLRDRVVVITGGSSGIGKAVAKELLKRGAHVALVARKLDLLAAAQRELRAVAGSQRVTIHAGDAAVDAQMTSVMEAVARDHLGPIDAVVCSAGISCPREFELTPTSEFEQVLRVNVVGTRNAIMAALPHMRQGGGKADRPGGGRIVIVSSQAGQAALYGYTAYSASKFALHGLMQALTMELHTRRILVSLSFPPDTDTPLLAEENKQKPALTRVLSETSATVSAEAVAAGIVNGMECYQPYISVGFDGWMLATLTAGMGPAGSFAAGAAQVLTMGLWRLVSLIIQAQWYRTIAAHAAAK